MENFILENGIRLQVFEQEMPGMANEPMTILRYAIGANLVDIRWYRHLLKPADKQKLDQWTADLNEGNNQSAINFVI